MWSHEKHNLSEPTLFHLEEDSVNQDMEYHQVTIPFDRAGYENAEQTPTPTKLIANNYFLNPDGASYSQTSPELAVTSYVDPILLTTSGHPTNALGCNSTQTISNQGTHTTYRVEVLGLHEQIRDFPIIIGNDRSARNRSLCRGHKMIERK